MNPTATFKTLDDWLPWLESLSPREIVLGLERVHEVLGRLELARPELVINVAGTNGKGSSVAMLEALLRQGGIRTGCYTSPHINRYNERTRIDGEPASDAAIIAALDRVEAARQDVPLTYFEFGTLATLVAFDTANVEAWVLEVGMGGRLDAVNAIEPDAGLITNVSLDHCAWLGNDIESIAAEKAGIMRPSRPVVFGSTNVPDAIRKKAELTGARLLLAGESFSSDEAGGETWSWQGEAVSLSGLSRPSLTGSAQIENASAVLAVLEALGRTDLLQPADVSTALSSLTLQGRFQQVGERWILDVAHNPAAGTVLCRLLEDLPDKRGVTAIVGMLADKDVSGFASSLQSAVEFWIAVSVGGSRGQAAHELGRDIANETGQPCLLVPNLADALEFAENGIDSSRRILVTGSFLVVGPALEWIRGN